MNVVSRAAAVSAVEWILLLVKLGECGFYKRGCRADQSRYPHPENSARATC